jgi:hypothetical protein
MNLESKQKHTLLSSGQLRVLTYGLLATPIACFTILLVVYAVDVPWMDDIDAFLSFIIGYVDSPTSGQKLDWLLRPNNEHRMLTAKLITLAMYTLTGTVNFRWLVFISFVFLLGILYLFYRVFRSIQLPLLAFVPVLFLVLQPQHYLTTMWAITGLQHLVAVSLTFFALYGLASNTRNRFVGSLGIQAWASLSMSNGLFGWVAGIVVLFLQRQWIRLLIWLVVGTATIIFYFHDFPNGQGNESSVGFFLHYPYIVFLGFFTFLGGLFDFFPTVPIVLRSVLPTAMGGVLVAVLIGLLWRMNKSILPWKPTVQPASMDEAARQKRRYFFTGCFVFLLINATIIAFLRPRFGYHVMLVSNYMIYPALLVSLLYLTVLSEYAGRPAIKFWTVPVLLGSLGIWFFWYAVRLPKIAYRREELLTSSFNQKHNQTGLGASWGTAFATFSDRTMSEAVKRGVYAYPSFYVAPYETGLESFRKQLTDSTLHLRMEWGGYSYLTETDYNAYAQPIRHAAVVVQSEKNTYLFPSELPYTPATYYLNRPIRTVRAQIGKAILPAGRYRVGVLALSPGNENVIRFSRQSLVVD